MISERTLRQWRKDSLSQAYSVDSKESENTDPGTFVTINHLDQLHERILRLTQELMDIQLIKRGR